MESLVEPMSKLLANYKSLGHHRAILNWLSCSDPEKTHSETKRRSKTIYKIEQDIANLLIHLKTSLNECDLAILLMECDSLEATHRESKELQIEADHRPTDVFFNDKTIFNLTNVNIPEDIQIGLSFGYKFLFPYACTDKNMCEILAQLDLTIEQSIPDLNQLGATLEICRILRKQSRMQYDLNKVWLSFINLRTKQFLFQHKDFLLPNLIRVDTQ